MAEKLIDFLRHGRFCNPDRFAKCRFVVIKNSKGGKDIYPSTPSDSPTTTPDFTSQAHPSFDSSITFLNLIQHFLFSLPSASSFSPTKTNQKSPLGVVPEPQRKLPLWMLEATVAFLPCWCCQTWCLDGTVRCGCDRFSLWLGRWCVIFFWGKDRKTWKVNVPP